MGASLLYSGYDATVGYWEIPNVCAFKSVGKIPCGFHHLRPLICHWVIVSVRTPWKSSCVFAASVIIPPYGNALTYMQVLIVIDSDRQYIQNTSLFVMPRHYWVPMQIAVHQGGFTKHSCSRGVSRGFAVAKRSASPDMHNHQLNDLPDSFKYGCDNHQA